MNANELKQRAKEWLEDITDNALENNTDDLGVYDEVYLVALAIIEQGFQSLTEEMVQEELKEVIGEEQAD